MNIRASIIVPTYNGANKIGSLLSSLANQTVKEFELIIVVDGSTDNTLSMLSQLKTKIQNIRIIEQENMGRSAVRNRGAREATGDLFIFYDDDMVPFPESINQHLQFHLTYKGICTGNQREQPDEKKSDIHNYKAALSEKWLKPYPDGITKLTAATLFFTAANCSVMRDDFVKLGGFDERLSDAEDFDFAYRALQMGMSVYFNKANDAWHEEQYTLEKLITRQTQYARAHRKLVAIHAALQKPQEFQSALKKVVLAFFRSKFCMFVLKSALFKLLPRQIRYKLYDWVIFAHSLL